MSPNLSLFSRKKIGICLCYIPIHSTPFLGDKKEATESMVKDSMIHFHNTKDNYCTTLVASIALAFFILLFTVADDSPTTTMVKSQVTRGVTNWFYLYSSQFR